MMPLVYSGVKERDDREYVREQKGMKKKKKKRIEEGTPNRWGRNHRKECYFVTFDHGYISSLFFFFSFLFIIRVTY